MASSTLDEIDLTGREYLTVVTDLLLHATGDDPMASLCEAADLQWWWKDEESLADRRYTFWFDAGNQPVACLLMTEQVLQQDALGAIDCNLLWRPSADALVRAQVFPEAIHRLTGVRSGSNRPVSITVDERDTDLRQRLEKAGFRREPHEDLKQMWQAREMLPDSLPLPNGMRFDDDRSRLADQPHHLAKRNGQHVAERLRECSLYRPDLGLCIRTETGDVAAYCICWLDPINKVGLFEPVRTESAYQRRGLGRALLTEGIRRLRAGGAEMLKVNFEQTNESARGLYASVGFHEAFGILAYVRA